MRILIIHNFYQDAGGEDLVYRQERELLAQTAEVDVLEFHNRKGLKGIFQFITYPFNIMAANKLSAKIKQFKPDIIHIHNLHYASGPQLIAAAKRHGIPVVMTLHNYRLLCPSATLYHRGAIFTDSISRAFPWKAVRLGVWTGSPLKTFWLAFTNYLHRRIGTWQQVDRYFVLTEFARQLFIHSTLGVPRHRWQVKPNFLVEKNQQQPSNRGRDYLFVGRLSEEKGIRTLVNAFKSSTRSLRIAGDGPLMEELRTVSQKWPNIQLLGALTAEQVHREMTACRALIFPSVWYEGMPMTLLEAFASQTPVIASKLGAMGDMIEDGENGLLFNAGDSSSLERALQRWEAWEHEDQIRIGRQAYQTYQQRYSSLVNQKILLETYQELLKK